MIYRQTSTIRKILEVLIVFIGLGVLDQYFEMEMREWILNPFLLALLLFSLRYGLMIGLLGFLFTIVYYSVDTVWSGGDVFLLYYDNTLFTEIFFLLIIVVIGGLYGTSFKERYDTLSDKNAEIKEENEEIKDVLALMEDSQRSMQNQVLESEYTLKRIYEVGKALDQPTPDLVRNEAISVISDLFGAEEIAIYHMDSSRIAMRLKERKGPEEVFPQTVFINEDTLMYRRLLSNKTVTIRTIDDEDDAPLLAGPIMWGNEVQDILIINDLEFDRMTRYQIQILSLILDWLSNRIEKSHESVMKEEEMEMFPGTHIYYKDAFDEKVALQQQRKDDYDVDFSVIQLKFEGFHGMSKIEAEIILRTYLRELDIIGFDEKNQEFYFLLPGTHPEDVSIVEDRIRKALYEKGGNYV
ncbi:K+-sensing histidine kinase KdpD [Alkalibacillus flavidus]|uniref:K+-sensing histidine kinase KdpD n=1 Tax=Alkalibacillus flavidus TaxID=546021 RepID=A0ABV2KTI9_9BACI